MLSPSAVPDSSLPDSAPEGSRALVSEIDDTLVELQQLSRTSLSHEEYYRRLLSLSADTVAATSAGLWSITAGNGATLALSHGPSAFEGPAGALRYRTIRQRLAERLQREPESTSQTFELEFDRGCALVAYVPVLASDVLTALVFIYDAPLPADVLPGIKLFVGKVAELASKFEARQSASRGQAIDGEWRRFAQFAAQVHRDGSVRDVAEEIVQQTSRCLECGRVSVVLKSRGRFAALAISGLERFHRRAQGVQALERLAIVTARSGQPLNTNSHREELAPELEAALDSYLDESGARTLVAIPLYAPTDGDEVAAQPFGVLICESFDDSKLGAEGAMLERIVSHSALALDRARRDASLPFAGRLLRFAHRRSWLAVSRFPLWILGASALGAAVLALGMIRTELKIDAVGTVEPVQLRHVFAPLDGVIDRAKFDPGQQVRAGDPLLTLRSVEVELLIDRLQGEIDLAQREQAVLRAETTQQDDRSLEGSRKLRDLAAREGLLTKKLANLVKQLQIAESQAESLKLRAPLSGEVITWEAEESLAGRPVRRGARLLTIADLAGEWRLVLQVPDRSMGHVLAARESSNTPLAIEFVLASAPEVTYSATVTTIATAAQVEPGSTAATVTIHGAFDVDAVRDRLRPNATVNATVHCGERSVGYVWFHEVYEEFRRHIF